MEDFSWFSLIPLVKRYHILEIFFTSSLVTLFMALLIILFRKRLKRREPDLSSFVPESRLSIRNIFELFGEGILGMMRGVMGEKAWEHIHFISALFLYVFLCNIIGLIPGFLPPTDNLNTNFSCAITVFIYYNYHGIKRHGISYIKHFTGPIWWLAILMIPIELISHLVRPLSLSIRLFGNIMGDHYVISIFTDLVPFIVPIPFLVLGIFVSFVQAFIFSILSVLYISMAISEEH